MERRHFFKAGTGALLTTWPGSSLMAASLGMAPAEAEAKGRIAPRDRWLHYLQQVMRPLWLHLGQGTLVANMPIQIYKGETGRKRVAHLEAVARSLGGLAPWLNATGLSTTEAAMQATYTEAVLNGLDHMTDPAHPDYMDMGITGQNLVDASFLCHALLLAPNLWAQVPQPVRQRLYTELEKTRKFKPVENNWLLFSALIEVFLHQQGREHKPEVITYALDRHNQWYKGDGHYGDGPSFHADYYNSYVIHPYLMAVATHYPPAAAQKATLLARAQRYAAVLERMIHTDGSFPATGRSLVYRCGAFHHLAYMSVTEQLPKDLAPGAVREALYATQQRTLGNPKSFDKGGWLTIGLNGYQPNLGEVYITTGSVYLAALAFMPLGLPPTHPFWTDAPQPWTARRIWELGEDLPPDKALKDL